MQSQLPATVSEIASQFFNHSAINKALPFIADSKLKPSFSKGGYHDNFIISGLIAERETINTRVSYRDHKITSKCNCPQWNKEQHCPHVVAFFLHFLLSESDLLEKSANIPKSENKEATPPQFLGKMVRRPSSLQGGQSKHYSEMKYQLMNGSIVDFSAPEDLSEKVKLVFNITTDQPNILSQKSNHWPVNFLLRENSENYKNITLFDTQFVYNWDTGQSYNIPEEIRSLLKQLQEDHFYTEPYILFYQLHKTNIASKTICTFKESPIETSLAQTIKLQFTIEESSKKYHYSLKTFFINKEGDYIHVPSFARSLVKEGGTLEDFSSKIERGNFLDHYFTGDPNFQKYSYTVSQRNIFLNCVTPILEGQDLIFIDKKTEKIYRLEHSYYQAIQSIYSTFGKNVFQTSSFSEFSPAFIEYSLPSALFESKLPTFFRQQDELDIQIFFNQKKIRRWKSSSKIQRNFSSEDWFDISIELTEEEIQLINEFSKNQHTYIDRENLILLTDEDKDFLNLVKKYLSEDSIEKDKKNDGKTKFSLTLNRCRLFDIYNLYQSSGFDLLTQEEKETCQKLLDINSIPPFSFPSKIKGVPRDYQVQGYQWLRLLHDLKLGACLADDMGLGKTFQTITFLESIQNSNSKVLVVCPVSILMNWKSEFEKFSTMNPVLYYGDQRIIPQDAQVIITSYGLLRKESDTVFSSINWDVLVLDEVQKLKNPKSVGTQAARKIKSKFRICLTGTPVENDLSEFYNIIDLSVPGIWGGQKNLNYFKKNKNARFIARDIAKPFILRRTKAQVLKDLPEKLEQTIHLTFGKEEKSNYLSTISNIRKQLSENTQTKKYAQILKDLLRLRQLCLWQDISNGLHSTKIDFLLNTLEQIIQEDHQVLIYSQFTKYLDIIQNKITKNKWKFSRIDGSYTIKKRQKEVDKFQSGENKLFLISLKAGGLGLNLTKANYIFIMDPWWNPAVENQAIDRAYRIGQKRNITVYRPIIKDSVEEKVLQLQEKKNQLFKDLLDQKDQADFSGKLSLEDFKMILS